jgi:hypothetical protein
MVFSSWAQHCQPSMVDVMVAMMVPRGTEDVRHGPVA